LSDLRSSCRSRDPARLFHRSRTTKQISGADEGIFPTCEKGLKQVPVINTAMKLPRREFLRLAALAIGVPALSRMACAQAYPARPVRIFVGFAAGGAPDIAARLMAQWLSERFGQQFIIENRPGAGGNIATEAVVDASADGYTLL
jgi:Tripartite tricarboxylate transporter family receptor